MFTTAKDSPAISRKAIVDKSYVPIQYDPNKTRATNNVGFERVYKRDIEDYGEGHSNALIRHPALPGKVAQIANHVPLKTDSPANSRKKVSIDESRLWIYVIVIDKNDNFILKVSRSTLHFFLANKAEYVIAAGRFEVKDRDIISIDEESGGYYLDNLTPEELIIYQRSLYLAFQKATVANEKDQEYESYKLSWDKFRPAYMQKLPIETILDPKYDDHEKNKIIIEGIMRKKAAQVEKITRELKWNERKRILRSAFSTSVHSLFSYPKTTIAVATVTALTVTIGIVNYVINLSDTTNSNNTPKL